MLKRSSGSKKGSCGGTPRVGKVGDPKPVGGCRQGGGGNRGGYRRGR